MILIFLVYSFASFIIASATEFKDCSRKITLEKCLLSNLKAHHADVDVKHILNSHEFHLDARAAEETKSSSILSIEDISTDIQVQMLSFLNVNELFQTRLVSPHFCNVSNYVNYMNLRNYNPDFVLKESWMNLVLSSFLFKHFENGHLNADDLLMAEQDILFDKNSFGSAAMSLLSFVHEYENGISSSLPFTPSDLLVEIIAKNVDQELPKSMKIVDKALNQYLNAHSYNEECKYVLKNFFNDTIRIISEKPDTAIIAQHFKFDPDISLNNTRLKLLPLFLLVSSFNLILPLCHREGQFFDAVEMTIKGLIFPQILFDQLEEKFPHLTDDLFLGFCSIFPVGFRALIEHHPRNDVVGLKYLLTRSAANPFNLQELLSMSPDISQLIFAFLPRNTMTLTETDMLNQMNEAGVFNDLIHDQELFLKLQSAISSEARLKHLSTFSHLYQKSKI